MPIELGVFLRVLEIFVGECRFGLVLLLDYRRLYLGPLWDWLLVWRVPWLVLRESALYSFIDLDREQWGG